jgi:hypothetical protein
MQNDADLGERQLEFMKHLRELGWVTHFNEDGGLFDPDFSAHGWERLSTLRRILQEMKLYPFTPQHAETLAGFLEISVPCRFGWEGFESPQGPAN